LNSRSQFIFLEAIPKKFKKIKNQGPDPEKIQIFEFKKLTSEVSWSGIMPAGGRMAEGRALPAPLVTGSTDRATSLTPPGISSRALWS
jgi:hypothetical protein